LFGLNHKSVRNLAARVCCFFTTYRFVIVEVKDDCKESKIVIVAAEINQIKDPVYTEHKPVPEFTIFWSYVFHENNRLPVIFRKDK